jgi:hypothetical protein
VDRIPVFFQSENFQLQLSESAGKFFDAIAGFYCTYNQPDGNKEGNSQYQNDD